MMKMLRISVALQVYPCISNITHTYLAMSRNNKDKAISVRLAETMLDALDARAEVDGKDRTQIIRDAISQYLGLPADNLDEKVSSLEERQSYLAGMTKELNAKIRQESERTNALEADVKELSLTVAAVLRRLP